MTDGNTTLQLGVKLGLEADDTFLALQELEKEVKDAQRRLQEMGDAGEFAMTSLAKISEKATFAKNSVKTLTSAFDVSTGPQRYASALQNANSTLVKSTRNAGALLDVFGKMKGIIGGFGLGLLTTQLPNLTRNLFAGNVESESMKLRYASAFNLQGSGSVEENKLNFAALDPLLQKAGLSSPGSATGMAAAITQSASSLAKARATTEEQAKFGELITLLGMTQLNGQVDMAASQLMAMMQGGAGVDSQTAQLLVKPLGDALKTRGLMREDQEVTFASLNEVAKVDQRGYFLAALDAMTSLKAVGDEYGDSFVGLASTMDEYKRSVKVAFATPLYEYATNQMREMSSWLETNLDSLKDIAETVGSVLTKGLSVSVGLLKAVASNLHWIAGGLTVIYGKKLAIQAIDMIGAPLPIGNTIGKAIGGYNQYAATSRQAFSNVWESGSGGLLRAVETLADFTVGRFDPITRKLGADHNITSGGRKKDLWSTLGSAATGVIPALTGGVSSILPAVTSVLGGFANLAIVLAPIAGLVSMVAGTFLILTDTSHEWSQFFFGQVDALMVELDVLASQFVPAGQGFAGMMKSFAEFMGGGVVGALSLVTAGARMMTEVFNNLTIMFKALYEASAPIFSSLLNRDFSGVMNAFGSFGDTFLDTSSQLLNENEKKRKSELQTKATERIKKKNEKKKDEAKVGRPHINVVIKQDIKTDANPDRIAYATREILEKSLFTRPRSAFDFGY